MTAKEIWDNGWNNKGLTPLEIMREFAKYHVQQALLQAAEKAKTLDIWDGTEGPSDAIVNKESILNSYNIENVK